MLGILGSQLKETQASLDGARKDLAEIEERAIGTKLHNPYLDQEKATAASRVKAWEGAEAKLQETIGLIETGGETIQAETEI